MKLSFQLCVCFPILVFNSTGRKENIWISADTLQYFFIEYLTSIWSENLKEALEVWHGKYSVNGVLC